MVTVLSFRETSHPLFKQGINTTSRSDGWSRDLSPFFLGPIPLYGGRVAKKMENAWQYTKVYDRPEFYDHDRDEVLPGYYEWAQYGWGRERADRYPMGRGVKPLFSVWDGQRLTYVEARRKVYAPLYANTVKGGEAYARLQQIHQESGEVVLLDFDAYDHRRLDMSWSDVMNCSTKKMGHAFVLAMLLEGVLDEVLAEPFPRPEMVQGSLF